MGDYFGHWLAVGKSLKSPPRIFRVNWFRTDAQGRFLWPGFGENLRVLKWILERCEGRGKVVETAIGLVPSRDAIDRSGLDISDKAMAELLDVDPADWLDAVADQEDFLKSYDGRMPSEIWEEHRSLARRVGEAVAI
jgi:phosphoenolpyruvate carboxykinase (GTP)